MSRYVVSGSGACRAVVTLWILGTLLPTPNRCHALQPTGSRVGAVQFDAVIEVNSESNVSHVLLFARYWVGPDYYGLGITWGEPHGIGLDLSLYPPTLVIVSNKAGFEVLHDIRSEYAASYARPLGERGVFGFMYGDYPIQNTRFAEQEALATRLYGQDFTDVNWCVGDVNETLEMSHADNRERAISRLNVHACDGRIESITLFDFESRMLKDIDYAYAERNGHVQLLRQQVYLPERPLAVALQGDGFRVKVREKEYKCTRFDAVHHEGGRKCTIEYEPVTLNGKDVLLPTQEIVWDGRKEKILRSVRMMNFKRVDLDANGVKEAARRFCGFTDKDREYRDLLIKYWKKPSAEIAQGDRDTIERLRSHYADDLPRQDTLGAQLKHLNILMELDRMAADATSLSHHYKQYLSMLSVHGLRQMIQAGGHNAVQTLMLWGRYAEADVLLDQWVDAVLQEFDDCGALLRFCQGELIKRHLWTTFRLLGRASAKFKQSTDDAFQIQTLRCEILDQLDFFLCNPNSDAPEDVLAQSQWVITSVGQEGLRRLLRQSLSEASHTSRSIINPTSGQQELKESLKRIEERIEQEDVQREML